VGDFEVTGVGASGTCIGNTTMVGGLRVGNATGISLTVDSDGASLGDSLGLELGDVLTGAGFPGVGREGIDLGVRDVRVGTTIDVGGTKTFGIGTSARDFGGIWLGDSVGDSLGL
jgi:hypothetical protein